jgi:hypothetical protein
MTMMVVIVMIGLNQTVVMVPVMVMKPLNHAQRIVVPVKLVTLVNMISQLTDLNAAILHGMSMV